MLLRPAGWSLTLLLALSGCQDALTPVNPAFLGGRPELSEVSSQPPVLQQSPAAPPLEAYRVSFWAPVAKPSSVTVSYQPAAGESVGQPFLRFDIPKNGIVAGADGLQVQKTDSVLIRITIDTVTFDLDFQPAGLLFSTKAPATLTLWWGNANLDLNGNGVVDGWDRNQLQNLALWYQATGSSGYKVSSKNDTTQQYVTGSLYHFSQYALSW